MPGASLVSYHPPHSTDIPRYLSFLLKPCTRHFDFATLTLFNIMNGLLRNQYALETIVTQGRKTVLLLPCREKLILL